MIPARVGKATDRARALDVSVRQGLSGRGGERADSRLLNDVTLFPERAEDVAHDPLMVSRCRSREEVVRQSKAPEVITDDSAVPIDELTRRETFAVSSNHDRGPVLVGSADHQHVVPTQTVVAREDVGRDAKARDMADVAWTVRVRPCHCDENLPGGGHRQSSYEQLSVSPGH